MMFPYIQFRTEKTVEFLRKMVSIYKNHFKSYLRTITLVDLMASLKELPYQKDLNLSQISRPEQTLHGVNTVNCKDHALFCALWCELNAHRGVESWRFETTETHIYVRAVIGGENIICDPLGVIPE